MNVPCSLTIAAITLGVAAGAGAQTYPPKPVRMLVAFPAGGSADIVARVLGQRLSESVGPAKMPRELVTRLHGEIDKVLKQPETQAKLKDVGVDIIGTNPEQAAAFVKSEYEKWAKLIQASGAKVD